MTTNKNVWIIGTVLLLVVFYMSDPTLFGILQAGGEPDCSDAIDNDNDNYIDFPDDIGCLSDLDESESNAQCSDGVDNDGDTKIDYPTDPGCRGQFDSSEGSDVPGSPPDGGSSQNSQCADGLDNDQQQGIDLADPDCESPTDGTEGNTGGETGSPQQPGNTSGVSPGSQPAQESPKLERSPTKCYSDGQETDCPEVPASIQLGTLRDDSNSLTKAQGLGESCDIEPREGNIKWNKVGNAAGSCIGAAAMFSVAPLCGSLFAAAPITFGTSTIVGAGCFGITIGGGTALAAQCYTRGKAVLADQANIGHNVDILCTPECESRLCLADELLSSDNDGTCIDQNDPKIEQLGQYGDSVFVDFHDDVCCIYADDDGDGKYTRECSQYSRNWLTFEISDYDVKVILQQEVPVEASQDIPIVKESDSSGLLGDPCKKNSDCMIGVCQAVNDEMRCAKSDNPPSPPITCTVDTDKDTVCDAQDNCVNIVNVDQRDSDKDKTGDACQDSDSDGILDDGDNSGSIFNKPCKTGEKQLCDDNCFEANPDQKDADADGLGDVCDTAPAIPKPTLRCEDDPKNNVDTDKDGIGDICDVDRDNDKINETGYSFRCGLGNHIGNDNCNDNCQSFANTDQRNADSDDLGDICDADVDNDGIPNDIIGVQNRCVGGETKQCLDNCFDLSNPIQEDADGDSIGDICDVDEPNVEDICFDGTNEQLNNHIKELGCIVDNNCKGNNPICVAFSDVCKKRIKTLDKSIQKFNGICKEKPKVSFNLLEWLSGNTGLSKDELTRGALTLAIIGVVGYIFMGKKKFNKKIKVRK